MRFVKRDPLLLWIILRVTVARCDISLNGLSRIASIKENYEFIF
jgi:hypothetical protein